MFRLVLIYLLFERESADEEMQRNTYTKFCLASLNIRLKSQCLYNKQNISSREDGQKYIPTKASRSIRLHAQLNEPQTRREDTANLALSKRTLFPGSIHNKRFQRLSSESNSRSRNDRGIDLFTGGMATAFHPQLCL